MEHIIKVTQQEKITTIRVTESTKKELESFGSAGNTHEDILKKIMKIVKSADSETKVVRQGNAIGTKYGKLIRTFIIETDKGKYSIVCKFNDLSFMNLMLENKNIQENFAKEWELDLEIVNMMVDVQKYTKKQRTVIWSNPDILCKSDKHEYLLLYLVAVKQALEGIFSIKIYEVTTQDDYFDIEKWRSAFARNKLSMESFYKDIQEKMR